MKLAGWLLLLVVLCFFLMAANLTPLLPVDDSYITFRYVRNWTEGQGLVFNAGERVEAYSNFLWTLLVAALAWLGLTPPVAARLLSWGALVGCAAAIVALSRRRSPEAPAVLHAAAGVVFLVLPATIFLALSGLETVLTAFLLVAFAWLLELDIGTRSHSVFIGLMLATISIARPEGLLFSLLVLLALAVLLAVGDHPPNQRLGLVVAVFLTPVALFFAWRLFYYGDLLPNSVTAKSVGLYLPALWAGVDYVRKFVLSYAPLLVLGAVSLIQAPRRDILAVRVPAACTYLAVTLMGGFADGYPHTRYLFPLVPLLLVWASEGAWVIYRTGRALRGPVFGFFFASFLAIFVLTAQAFLSLTDYYATGMPYDAGRVLARPAGAIRGFFQPDSAPHTGSGREREGLGHHELAAWLQKHASPHDLLATYEIGIVPYYSRLPVMDLFGLADARIARSPGLPGLRAHPDYAFGRSPRYMACRVPSDCLCLYYPVFRSPEFRENYDLAAVFTYQDTKWLLFERRSRPVSEVEHWLGWDHSTDQPVTARENGLARVVPVRIRGQVQLDPYLQRAEPLYKERLFLEILNHPESDSARDAMRAWLETFRKAFVFSPEQGNSPSGLDFELVVPPGSDLEFALATRYEGASAIDPQSLDVSVVTKSASETLFRRDFARASDLKLGWDIIRLDLEQFSGQRVRLSFSRSTSRKPVSIAVGEPRIVETDHGLRPSHPGARLLSHDISP